MFELGNSKGIPEPWQKPKPKFALGPIFNELICEKHFEVGNRERLTRACRIRPVIRIQRRGSERVCSDVL